MKHPPTASPVPNNFPHVFRTLVVDNSVVFLKSLCSYLKTQPLFQVIGTAADGGEALRVVELLGPDLVLMDLHMPVIDGLQATAILRRRMPNVRIIIMTLEDPATLKAEAWAHGSHGFIWKPQITNDLITEVHQVFHSNHTKDNLPLGRHI
jgi:DNA-binding NarL/FixJ family response regulator